MGLCLSILLSLVFGQWSSAQSISKEAAAGFTSNVQSWEAKKATVVEVKKEGTARWSFDYTEIHTFGGKQFPESELFTDTSDLIIGIDTTGNTKGHMYIMVSGLGRFEGRLFYVASVFDPHRLALSNGMILRYKKIPQSNRRRIVRWARSGENIRGPTCVFAGEKLVIDIAGLGNSEGPHWFPRGFLEDLAEKGLKGADGQALKPDIYLLNTEVHDFWDNLPTREKIPHFMGKVIKDPNTWHAANRPKN